MSECIFCKIINKQLPSKLIYEDEEFVAFDDINPKAPVHVLVVPKKHIESVNGLTEADQGLVGRLLLTTKKVAGKLGIVAAYRLEIYVGAGAGQTVFHLHLHLLGGFRQKGGPA